MASGDTLLVFTPLHNEPPTANYATLDTINSHPVLDFSGGGTNESAIFSAVMPQNYAGGGIEVYIHYATDATDEEDIDWDAAFERIGEAVLDIDADSFAAVQSVDNTATPAISHEIDIVVIAFTDGAEMDSVAVGEAFRLKITRDTASDVMTEDANLIRVEIREA
jgi:hypothetical protein